MCGRYVTISSLKAIEKRFNVKAEAPERYNPNVNVSLGQNAPVIASDQPGKVQFFVFGMTPVWAQKPMYLFNARSEGDHNKEDDPRYTGAMGIIQKPAFRKSIRERRCLVIADAFIEGPKKEKLSKPYVVYMRNPEHKPFAFAGLWDEWVNRETGEVLRSFSIITSVANSLLQKIGHHRSPVILNPGDEHTWLNPDSPLADITALLRPFDASLMNAYPIAPAIKTPGVNAPELLQPIGQRVEKEYDYEIYNDLKLEGMGSTSARVRKNKEN